jgi:PAS domain S-box-containing protein
MSHRVLVVEDSRAINELVCETLQARGFLCDSAFDGEEALRTFRRLQPDAVVLDLNIPRMHGIEVLRAIKAGHPFTVVVVLTGHGSDQTAMQALKMGADDYLTKPVRQGRLAHALQVHIERAGLQKSLELPAGCPAGLEDRHLSRVFFHAPPALLHVDGDLAIRAVNRAAARLLGRTPEQLKGGSLGAVVAPEVRAGWLAAVQRDAAGPQGYEGEVHVVRGSEVFPAQATAVAGPDPGHLVLCLRDLTRQKLWEERFFESKKLASLGRVVEGVAHEVRNPLISIGGFARKLLEQAAPDSRDRSYLGVVVHEVERLERMVHDIEGYVAFSRQNRPRFAPVSLTEVLRTSVERHVDGNGSIQVSFESPEELPCLYADSALMAELFDGLVENAADAMPGGGRLAVSLRLVDGWLQTRLADTGVGIAADDLEEIFDPFFTSKTSGAGLGLAKAYLIVEDHSGTIDFESTVDQGTTCTVSLPLDRRKVARGR